MATNSDRAEILKTWDLFRQPGEVLELRIPKAGRFKTISGYFNEAGKLADAVIGLADEPFAGIYFTVNPVKPDLLARASNRYVKYAETTTSDADIIVLHWLPVDLDAKRPAGISSTNEEHEAAISKASEIRSWLIEELAWPIGAFILADSGNGGHLNVKIDLPNLPENVALVTACLECLDFLFSDDTIEVDTTSQNPARIWKMYGTMARKGDNTTERPHRLAKLLEVPEALEMVAREKLEALAAMLPEQEEQPKTYTGGQGFDPVAYCQAHNLQVHHTKAYKGGTLAVLDECIFDSSHKLSAAIIGWPSGGHDYTCRHRSCLNKHWSDAKAAIEPHKANLDNNLGRIEEIKQGRIKQKFTPEKQEPEANGPETSDHEFATDGGNAQRLIRLHKNNIKYCHTFKKWMYWDGHRWKIDGDGSAYRFCDDVIREIYSEAAACVDSKDRSEWAKFAIRSDSGRGYRDMLFLASFNKAIALTSDRLDANSWLLNTENLTIDLKTFEAREPRREDLITKAIGTRYDQTAKCPLWLKFLDKIFGGDSELINYTQRAVGYSLTGSMVEQVYFFCHGTGANGKSVFLATLRALLGDYAKQASFDTFLIQHTVKVRNDLAALAGARIITASEAEEGSRLSMQVIKSWTGGDPITARFLFGEDFTFNPCGKIWLAANTKPHISERNYAAWRRVHLIPFLVTIALEEQDRDLENKLREELPGVLIWALEGLKGYSRIGLQPPEAVKAATDAYRRENDSLAAFISECCEVQKLAICKNSDLFGSYLNFCGMGGEEPLSQTKFSLDLAGMPGIRRTRDRKLGMIWHGIELSKNWSDPENTNPYAAQGVKGVKANPQSFEKSPSRGYFSDKPSHPSHPSPDSDSKKSNPSQNIPILNDKNNIGSGEGLKKSSPIQDTIGIVPRPSRVLPTPSLGEKKEKEKDEEKKKGVDKVGLKQTMDGLDTREKCKCKTVEDVVNCLDHNLTEIQNPVLADWLHKQGLPYIPITFLLKDRGWKQDDVTRTMHKAAVSKA